MSKSVVSKSINTFIAVGRRFALLILLSLGVLSGSLITGQATTLPWRITHAAGTDFTVYGDALAPNWQDWSWNSSVNFNNANPHHSGATASAVTFNQAWAGLSLRAPSPLTGSLYTAVTFWVYYRMVITDKKVELSFNKRIRLPQKRRRTKPG